MKITRTRATGIVMGAVMAVGAGVGLSACDGASTAKAPAPTAQAPAKHHDDVSDGAVSLLKAFTAENGTAGQQEAVSHVKAIHEATSLVSTTDITTTYSGDLTGPNGPAGKNIAEAWAAFRHTDDGAGLVTVYSDSGNILSNGNY